ncbi:MAG: hypothetical protein LBF68_02035 [Christensenellaceae bacterium]|jgi:hypothetical protein|nr:hypothetical protein [Christensenellaceae bacterium]
MALLKRGGEWLLNTNIKDATSVKLSSADFIMSRVTIYEKEPGDEHGKFLLKNIDYFCELSTAPKKHSQIEKNDKAFVDSPYWNKIMWVGTLKKSCFPSYVDVLRVVPKR